jgi:hypothetical protein
MVLRNDTNRLKDKLVFFLSMAELSGKVNIDLEAAIEVFMVISRNISCHKKVKNLWVGNASGGNLCHLKVDKNRGTHLGSWDKLQNELQSTLGLQCDHFGVPY